ncbi:unnamed protein product [Schistosoma curassoni]|uniref:Dirigent protein n=1 Tax=Schistosoma curassoni TaxID=6186 RepID=A0A183JSR0_9TREM|nr:unnamed protein product [Schistosoma curassoni]
MLVKPGLSEFRMLDVSLCSIIAVSEGLPTSSGNTMLTMQGFGIVCSGTETITQLVSPSLNIDFGGLDVFYECRPREFHIVHYLPTLGLVGRSGEVVSV